MSYPFYFDTDLWREMPIPRNNTGPETFQQSQRSAGGPAPQLLGAHERQQPLTAEQRAEIDRMIADAFDQSRVRQQLAVEEVQAFGFPPGIESPRIPDYSPCYVPASPMPEIYPRGDSPCYVPASPMPEIHPRGDSPCYVPASPMPEVPQRAYSPLISYTPAESPMLEFDDLPHPSTPEMLEIAARACSSRGEGSRQPNALHLQLSPQAHVNNICVEGWGSPRDHMEPEWQQPVQPWAYSPEPSDSEQLVSPSRDVSVQLDPEDLTADREFASTYRREAVGREHIVRHDFPYGILRYTIQTDPMDPETRFSGPLEELEAMVEGLDQAIAAYWSGPLRIRNKQLLLCHLERTDIDGPYNRHLWRQLGRFEHAYILRLEKEGKLSEWNKQTHVEEAVRQAKLRFGAKLVHRRGRYAERRR